MQSKETTFFSFEYIHTDKASLIFLRLPVAGYRIARNLLSNYIDIHMINTSI